MEATAKDFEFAGCELSWLMKRTGLSRPTLKRLIKQGNIPHRRTINGCWLVGLDTPDQIREYRKALHGKKRTHSATALLIWLSGQANIECVTRPLSN